jgi:hypothetical protein
VEELQATQGMAETEKNASPNSQPLGREEEAAAAVFRGRAVVAPAIKLRGEVEWGCLARVLRARLAALI